ncbi:MAG TPA: hypothetical protein VKW08_27890 [Xanthobacteraceae bacterium]|nr:hypothetical protein [Xanthobacteraceae bacterium]
MDQPKPPRNDRKRPESASERQKGNLILLGLFAAIVGIAIWLVNVMLDQRAIDECTAQGRRNCAPVGSAAGDR